MKPAPKPTIPRLASNVTARLTRLSRGPRAMVHRIRQQTGCDAVWCFGPDAGDEFDTATGEARPPVATKGLGEPSAELEERVAKLDPRTGLPKGEVDPCDP